MISQDIGRKQPTTTKLPQGRLRKMVVNGKILFATKSTLVVEIQGEEFTFDTSRQSCSELFKFVQVSELGAADPVECALAEILETKTIQAVAVKVDTHEVVLYGAPTEAYVRMENEVKKAQARSDT
jgi:hypothetical protein